MASAASIDIPLKHSDRLNSDHLDLNSIINLGSKNNTVSNTNSFDIDNTLSDLDIFLSDVVVGLSGRLKSLPCKYFYDAKGSSLFEKICDLDEYSLTKTESNLLSEVGKSLGRYFNDGLTIVDPGNSVGNKVQILMRELKDIERFFPLEISPAILGESVDTIQEIFPDLDITPLCGDFTDAQDLIELSQEIRCTSERLVFFPGSTIGNFKRVCAINILKNLSIIAGEGGYLLVGVDLLKNRQRLMKVYDDKGGVTAEFNKNILHRINSELDGNFDVSSGFEHVALFNERYKRIEMYLKSVVEQTVTISGNDFHFDKDEYIHTESSHKYSPESFSSIATEAGLELLEFWTDAEKKFGVFLLQAGS